MQKESPTEMTDTVGIEQTSNESLEQLTRAIPVPALISNEYLHEFPEDKDE